MNNALARSFLFFLIAPGSVAGYVPWAITRWQREPPLFGIEGLRDLGIVLIVLGLIPLVESFVRFAVRGEGTPASIAPAQKFAVSGFYRHVRNPMYVGVLAVIVGEALLLGDWRLLGYAAIVWVFMHLFIVAYEEPILRRNFGDEYAAFCAHVPRWLPRLQAWKA